jgi:transcriptional regulator with XRE-family HTH domain
VPARGNLYVRQLADELRRLRERANFTGQRAAGELNWSASKISRLEAGRVKIKEADLRSLLDLYAVTEQQRAELLTLLAESSEPAPGEVLAHTGYLTGFDEYTEAEARAVAIWEWESQVIPGLLQTADYARASMLGWNELLRLPPTELDVKVDERMARQQILARDDSPQYRVVLDEAAIHRRQGDNAVMRAQLEGVADRAALPNVELRLLPLDNPHSVNTTSFVYMQFSQDRLPRDVVYLEQLSGTHYIDDVDVTHQYQLVFQKLEADALDTRASADLIKSAALQYR